MSDAASQRRLVGLEPWLPWPLSISPWWTAPVPAERLAILRIAVAAVLLWDILQNYLPVYNVLYSDQGLLPPRVLSSAGRTQPWAWSLLRGAAEGNPDVIFWTMIVWMTAAVLLLLGLWTRLSAVLTWIVTVQIMHLNPLVGNGGDVVRVIILFHLMLSPCGAAWSVDAWRRGRHTPAGAGFLVPPWPLRLLFVQMALIYFVNGLYKIVSPQWQEGTILYYVLNDPTWTRVPFAQFPVPLWILRTSAWIVLVWELGFPLWVMLPWTRKAALAFGILFHCGIFLCLELGAFQLYMLALYLPLMLPRSHAGGSGTK